MTVRKQRFYWHVHHRMLIEWCYDYEERARYIQTEKPENEQEIRLRLFQPVKGNLPNEVIEAGQAYNKVRQVYEKAKQANDKAWQAYYKAGQAYNRASQAQDKAGQVYNKAKQAYNRARQVYEKAWQAINKASQAHEKAWQAINKALLDNKSAIKALHTSECTNCPWDGDTIFPNTQQ